MRQKFAVVKRVPGDGSCLYHSVVAGMNVRNDTSSRHLREKVANVLAKVLGGSNKVLSQTYLSLLMYYAGEQNVTPARYIRNTRACMWAGPLEIEILSKIIMRRIAVYNMDDLRPKKILGCVYDMNGVEPILDFGDKRRNQIMVAISGYKPNSNMFGTHFDALLPVILT